MIEHLLEELRDYDEAYQEREKAARDNDMCAYNRAETLMTEAKERLDSTLGAFVDHRIHLWKQGGGR
jgi:hypothetical protein